jgi:uncharacterized protein YwgA
MHPLVPLFQLLGLLKRIEGRKKLQKTVHILKELGAPFSESFEYSFYGMYSAQLKRELDVLVGERLATETRNNDTFVIESTPELSSVLKDLDLDQLPPWAGLAEQLNKYSPAMLEGISTALFLSRTQKDPHYVKSSLRSLKPRLTNLVDDCYSEAQKLRQIASAQISPKRVVD